MESTWERTAIVTGAARGIGLAIAGTLLELGIKTALNDVCSPDEVKENLAQLSRFRTPYEFIQADISTVEGRESLLNRVIDSWDDVHILVNNAGAAPRERKDILWTSEASFEHVLGVNLKGTFFLTQLVARAMVERVVRAVKPEIYAASSSERCVIMISSSNSRAAAVNRAEYCVSKAGVSMMTKLWAVRLAEYRIPVYEIQPGLILTDMTEPVRGKYDSLIESGFLLQRRWGRPEDVANAVRAIVRGDHSYSTGQVFLVDGGMFVEHY